MLHFVLILLTWNSILLILWFFSLLKIEFVVPYILKQFLCCSILLSPLGFHAVFWSYVLFCHLLPDPPSPPSTPTNVGFSSFCTIHWFQFVVYITWGCVDSMGQEESWMEMFKKFGTGPACVLVALPSPCMSPGLAMFLSLSSLVSCCPSDQALPHGHDACLLLYWLHLFSLHRVQRQRSPKASQDRALPVSLQLHHHFTWGFASFSEYARTLCVGSGLWPHRFSISLQFAAIVPFHF